MSSCVFRSPTARLAADAQANAVILNSVNGAVVISGPTAANVSVAGRVLSASGRGISNAVVVISNSNGTSRTARTNSFGYYRFGNMPAGQTYVLQTSAKGFVFNSQILTLQEDLTEYNIVAEE